MMITFFYSSCSSDEVDRGLIQESKKERHTEALVGVCKSKNKATPQGRGLLSSFYFKSTQGHKTKSKFLFLNKIVLTNFKICIIGYVSQIFEIQNLKLTLPITLQM